MVFYQIFLSIAYITITVITDRKELFLSICDVTHWTSEARNDETSPSTLLSLVDNFPCIPQSPAFTHTSILVVLGAGTPSQVLRFPCLPGCPSQCRIVKQHLTITSIFPTVVVTFCHLVLALLPVPPMPYCHYKHIKN